MTPKKCKFAHDQERSTVILVAALSFHQTVCHICGNWQNLVQSFVPGPSGCMSYRGAVTSLKGITLILSSFSFSMMNFASLFRQSKSSRESAIGTHEESSKGASFPSTVKYPLTEMVYIVKSRGCIVLLVEINSQKVLKS